MALIEGLVGGEVFPVGGDIYESELQVHPNIIAVLLLREVYGLSGQVCRELVTKRMCVHNASSALFFVRGDPVEQPLYPVISNADLFPALDEN